MAESESTAPSELRHNETPVSKVGVTGDSQEYVILGKKKYHKHDLMKAFGGTLTPGVAPYPVRQFGNPAPLGLSAFALTTFVLSLYNAQAMGIKVPNVVVSTATFYGGAVQFLAGIWELLLGNTFGATALTSYGAFWLSYASVFIKNFGISEAYKDKTMMNNAIGLYLVGWAIFTFMLTLVTAKSTVAFFSLFFSLMVTFILLAAGEFTGKVGVTRAGGVIGVICAFTAWYNAYAGVANRFNTYVTVRAVPLPVFEK